MSNHPSRSIVARYNVRQHKQEKKDSPLRPLWTIVHGWGHPGYTWYAVMSDGALLCEACCRKEYRQIVAETLDKASGKMESGWAVVGVTYSGEMEETEYCAHCGKVLPGLGTE